MQDIGATDSLSRLGVSADSFEQLASEAPAHFDWAPNPRAATVKDAVSLYTAAL